MGCPAHLPEVARSGEKIRAAYLAAGLNRNSFSRKIGTSYSTVSRWEDGDVEPRMASLRKISEALGVPLESLVDEEPHTTELSMSDEFRDWLDREAPEDLTDDERDTLATFRFRGLHPGPSWYTTALGVWRIATVGRVTRVRKVMPR